MNASGCWLLVTLRNENISEGYAIPTAFIE